MHIVQALNDAPAAISTTSLDPYGQLIKMLMPRAQSIAIYDRMGLPVWLNDGLDSPELHRLVQETLVRELRGEARPFSLVHGLLRPALECLQRELASQYSIGDLQRSLLTSDRDLELLLGAANDEAVAGETTDDFVQLLQDCVDQLGCSVGALLIPDKNIAVCRTGKGTAARAGAELLTKSHRELLAWTQLHRQTMTANRPGAGGQFGDVPYKILSCPVMHGARRVLGILALFKPPASPDFDLRQVRLVELLARRVAYILMNAYDPATGLLTRPAFERRAQALLTPEALQANHSVICVDIDRLHVLNENLGMHVGDQVIVRVADAMGLATVAECVESEQIHDIARRLGVEYGQGFSIGRPTPLERVIGDLLG